MDFTSLAEYFVTTARGIEPVTARELTELHATQVRPVTGGVYFEGDTSVLYRAVLWLRSASRILRTLREFAAINPEMLYSQTRRVAWEQYLNPQKTLAVHATIEGSGGRNKREGENRRAGINHSKYAALKIKDAIVDRLRHEQGARPNVDTQNPDVRIHAHFAGGRCTLSLDAVGHSLHERGYRLEQTAAPLKETLAAAIINLSGWDEKRQLLDPMCGSGTLVIEAALKALRIAPGLFRNDFAFQRWPDFDAALWDQIVGEAQEKRLVEPPCVILGSDTDPEAVRIARANAERAGVGHAVSFSVQNAEDAIPAEPEPGTIVVNPPYGERLGDSSELSKLYKRLGEVWQQRFGGWSICVFAGNLTLARDLELTASEKFKLNNGPLECRLLKFKMPTTVSH